MNAVARTTAVAVAAIIVVVVLASTFIVQQTETAFVLRFGAVQATSGQSGLGPGLHLRVPLIDSVVYFDRRILDLSLPAQEVIASDQKRLVVDAYARYRILDPLRFYQSVSNISGANNRLGNIISSTIRSVLADASFAGIIKTEREVLMKRISNEVDAAAKGLGIEIVDVRLRRVDLPEQNSQNVFQRMQSERRREATDIRAQGSQISQGIHAKADRDVTVIKAEADRHADELRGTGEAEQNRILAASYGKDPDFFAFYRSMQAYENSLKGGDTRMVISPKSDFFRYFNDPKGRPEGSGASAGSSPAAGGGQQSSNAAPAGSSPAPSGASARP